MFYVFVKYWVRLALPFFAKKLTITNKHHLAHKGPLVLAVNHPNSFLDAILIGDYMHEPVYYITRGDVFKKGWVRKFLHALKMIPIYRIRDGKDMLSLNDETFNKSMEVLRNNGVFLIFVEGFCEHQTTLQLPLKKGAPRILQACWKEGIDAKVLPVWLKYSSFNRFGKTLDIRFGEPFGKEIATNVESATTINEINRQTEKQLQALSEIQQKSADLPPLVRLLLFIPAMLGAVLHAPIYLPLQAACKKISASNVHYDSILLAMLIVAYPLYLIIICSVLAITSGLAWMWLGLIVFPLLAKAYVRWKP